MEEIKQLTLNDNNTNDCIELKSMLSAVECPFNWGLQNLEEKMLDGKSLIIELETKLREEEEDILQSQQDNDENQYYRLIILLLLTYVLKKENDAKAALQRVKDCEVIINKLDNERENPSFLDEIKTAFLHITLATKANLVKTNEIPLLINKIKPIDSMTNKELAAVMGLKSEIFLFMGHVGHQMAATFAEKAVTLNENESRWWFLAGKAMARVRRLEEKWNRDLLEEKELTYLQKAIELKRNFSYEVTLAQSYRECARNAYFLCSPYMDGYEVVEKNIDDMNKKSLELYMSALQGQQNCTSTIIRCAQGLMKLPRPYKNLQKAKRLIDKCLELSPQKSYVHHVAANFYEIYYPFQNFNEALKHLEIASNHGNYEATMNKILLKTKLYKMYDQFEDLKAAKERFAGKPLQLRIAKEFGAYYLFKKRDIISTLKHYSVIIEEDKGESLKIVVDETRLLLAENPSLPPEDQEIIQTFMHYIELGFSELLEEEPMRNQITEAIENSLTKT